jgi:hypothetical protein
MKTPSPQVTALNKPRTDRSALHALPPQRMFVILDKPLIV